MGILKGKQFTDWPREEENFCMSGYNTPCVYVDDGRCLASSTKCRFSNRVPKKCSSGKEAILYISGFLIRILLIKVSCLSSFQVLLLPPHRVVYSLPNPHQAQRQCRVDCKLSFDLTKATCCLFLALAPIVNIAGTWSRSADAVCQAGATQPKCSVVGREFAWFLACPQ